MGGLGPADTGAPLQLKLQYSTTDTQTLNTGAVPQHWCRPSTLVTSLNTGAVGGDVCQFKVRGVRNRIFSCMPQDVVHWSARECPGQPGQQLRG